MRYDISGGKLGGRPGREPPADDPSWHPPGDEVERGDRFSRDPTRTPTIDLREILDVPTGPPPALPEHVEGYSVGSGPRRASVNQAPSGGNTMATQAEIAAMVDGQVAQMNDIMGQLGELIAQASQCAQACGQIASETGSSGMEIAQIMYAVSESFDEQRGLVAQCVERAQSWSGGLRSL